MASATKTVEEDDNDTVSDATDRDDDDDDDNVNDKDPKSLGKKKKKKTEVLIFGADLTYESEPFQIYARTDDGDTMPAKLSAHDFDSFLKDWDTKGLLLGAGGKRPATKLTPTPELLDLWRDACSRYYGDEYLPPVTENTNDKLQIAACDSVVQFPGLKVITTVCNAVAKSSVTPSSSSSSTEASPSKPLPVQEELPYCEFILIGEKRTAEGPGPMVWVYNQLTGGNKMAKEKFNPSQAYAKTKISVRPILDTDNDNERQQEEKQQSPSMSYAFTFDLHMQVRVEFPRILVKILPTSKEKMEEQGSASVLKAVQGDVVDSINAIRNAFLASYGGTSP